MRAVRFFVCSLLLSLSFVAGAEEIAGAATLLLPNHEHGAFTIRSVDGEIACVDAGRVESLRINSRRNVQLRVFGENTGRIRTHGSAGLNIILRGTAQLDANPAAKEAFERAAEIWEGRIANPITVYVDVDYGPTRFGDPFEEGVIASASSDYRDATYGQIRPALVSHADNPAEVAVYGLLPNSSIPTDLGAAVAMGVPSILLRALGVLPATAADGDDAPAIGFNSAFSYDFNPDNGISPGQTDFEGVVVHEIGHMLGFVSLTGAVSQGIIDFPIPTVMDIFRFRPGVTNGTFTNAQRIQTPGGEQRYFGGGLTNAFSTGQPDGQGGDNRQASHWKDDAITGSRIGIMDPTLSAGVRSQLTDADLEVLDVIGFNIVDEGSSGPAAPSNLTATGTSTSIIRLNWTDNSSNELEFRIEQKVGANFVDIGASAANTTQINVTGFSAGQSATFRVRAKGAGDVFSAYSNEATGTTNSPPGSCVASDTTVCLLNNRFRVKIDYVNPFSNPPNQPGTFRAARLSAQPVVNPDTALFGFSSAQAVEVVVRIQDTRPFAPRFDIYYGGMTDVGYTVTVTDTQTGTTRTYNNVAGTVGGGLDRTSFPASVFASEDRLTSGGMDSFPAEMEPVMPGDLVGINEAGLRGSKVPEGVVIEKMPAAFDATIPPMVNAGGAGGCGEAESNNTTASANPLTSGVPCTGSASLVDSFTYGITNSGLGDDWRIHDVFKLTTGATGQITVNLTFSNASADLDMFVFDAALAVKGSATGSTTTENLTTISVPAGTYYIGVSAYSGSSSYTVTANGPGVAVPAAPSNLTATGTSTSIIRLNWTDNSSNENEFRVEQKVGANFVDLGAASANATQINVTGFSAGQTATFRVRARNGAGDSPYSNEATGTTQGNAGPCTANSTTVCLLNNRFRVKIDYINPFSNPPNQPGTFLAERLSSQAGINPDVGLFGFSSAQAVEVIVRIQDTRPFAPRYDVYYGGMTDVGYTVTVTDTQTGTTRQYTNTAGKVGGGVDRTSFPAN